MLCFALVGILNQFIVVPGKECTMVPCLFVNFIGENMSTCNAVFFSSGFKSVREPAWSIPECLMCGCESGPSCVISAGRDCPFLGGWQPWLPLAGESAWLLVAPTWSNLLLSIPHTKRSGPRSRFRRSAARERVGFICLFMCPAPSRLLCSI